MSENKLWQTTKNAVAHTGHWDRIESHAASQGRPDVNACCDGITFDIELKIYDSRRGGFVLRAAQNGWIQNRVRTGGNVWIFARFDGAGGQIFLLIPGNRSRALIHDRSYEGWANQAVKLWNNQPVWAEFMETVLNGSAMHKASRSSV